MKKAIVTLAVGSKFQNLFERRCLAGWSRYADRWGYDLAVFDAPLDTTEKGRSRHPSWQKLLALTDERVRECEQVVWVDADVIINPRSPDIGEGVPPECVGAVDAFSIPSEREHRAVKQCVYAHWDRAGIRYVPNLTPEEFYRCCGFERAYSRVVHAGVMVVSPRHHAAMLRSVYAEYEDKGSEWNAEMRALSHEVMSRGIGHWLDPRFNMLWPYLRAYWYPFTLRPPSRAERLLARCGYDMQDRLLREAATAAYRNAYFLHFAMSSSEMRYVDQS